MRAMTGLDLKLLRTAKRVRVIDLAKVMGVQHPSVSRIEAMASPTQRAAARYLAALATFPDVAPQPEAVPLVRTQPEERSAA